MNSDRLRDGKSLVAIAPRAFADPSGSPSVALGIFSHHRTKPRPGRMDAAARNRRFRQL